MSAIEVRGSVGSRATAEKPIDGAWLRRAGPALLAHPGLWATGLVQLRRLAAPRWWRRSPYLPLPDPAYLNFRLETMYGGRRPPQPEPEDLVAYLHWCKIQRLLAGGGSRTRRPKRR